MTTHDDLAHEQATEYRYGADLSHTARRVAARIKILRETHDAGIAAARAEVERLEARRDAALEGPERDYAETVGQLEVWHRGRVKAGLPKTEHLPGGTIEHRALPVRVHIADETELMAWLTDQGLDEQVCKVSVGLAPLKKLLADQSDRLKVRGRPGERFTPSDADLVGVALPPGVEVEVPHPKVTFKADV